ncbi:MAG: glutamate-5-semialdehyde dehydrogenase [Clostridia bacterium]|nr:glutamate-5-semialdehyde dehydrogenase [Clostridia bacterium]
MFDLTSLCKSAVEASKSLLSLSEEQINNALIGVADAIVQNGEKIISANAIDIEVAKSRGQSEGFIDRLTLNAKVLEGIALGIKQVANLLSPVGKVVYSHVDCEQKIKVEKTLVPFGVVGMIFESRPNVTADAFALCFKTSNAVILKGGSDALNSNKALVSVIRKALEDCNINANAVCLIEDTDRETTTKFMKMNKYVDLLIPRGGASLIRSAIENSTIPIIQTGTGNCHIYVDKSADVLKSAKVIFNAKTQRYSVCNACESIVVHSDRLIDLPVIASALQEKEVEIRADQRAFEVLKDYPFIKEASEQDFYTEYGSAVISVKTVDSLAEAIAHINEHSTGHSESIMTEDEASATEFSKKIDSSCVYHNASTRFSDGFQFGLGAEIGISTQKMHARGPMGLDALVTTKYVVKGDYSTRK